MVYLFLADGFEEIEALTCVDILRRANIEILTVSISEKNVKGAHGINVEADMLISDCGQAQMLILPGGGVGTDNLKASKPLADFIRTAHENGVYLAAICAAPTVFGGLGILSGKNAVCYPGLEDGLIGATVSSERVCVDGKIITSKGPGTTSEFALTLVEILKDKASADALRKGMLW